MRIPPPPPAALVAEDLSPIFNSQCFVSITEMLEAALGVDLVSREQMTERKLALVRQSCVILLSLVGWRGKSACQFISKVV